MPSSRNLTENMLWSLMAVLAAHFLAAWLFLGPPDAARRWNGVSPRPQNAWTLAPGQALDLEFTLPPPGRGAEELRLVAICKEEAGVPGLALRRGGELTSGRVEDDQIRFKLTVADSRQGLALVNRGEVPVRVAEYHLRNYAAENPNFPRMAVLWSGWSPKRALALHWLAAMAGGGLLLTLGAWLYLKPVWFWFLCAGPILALLAGGLAAAGSGLRPVLAWDALLLFGGMGPALWLLGRLGAWARRGIRQLPALIREASRPRQMTFLVMLVAAVFLPPILAGGPPARMPFAAAPLNHMKKYQPDYIIIGNSMAYTRINWPKLETMLPGRKVSMLRLPGSRMDAWYLMLKHYVVASGVKPKRVFLFFRDYNLTRVRRKQPERWLRTNEKLAPGNDPEFNQVIFGDPDPLRKKLATGLMDVFALGNWGFYWRERLKQWVTESTIPDWFAKKHVNSPDRLWVREVNRRFSLGHLRPDIQEGFEKNRRALYRFEQELPKSLLPHFIDLARKNHIPLMMVRVQRNPKPDGSVPQSAALKRYMADLRAYLAKEGVELYDFTGDPEVTYELYSSSDHIANEYRDHYTDIFYRRLKKFLQ